MTAASSLAGRATSGPRTGTDATESGRDCAAAAEQTSNSAALTECRNMAQVYRCSGHGSSRGASPPPPCPPALARRRALGGYRDARPLEDHMTRLPLSLLVAVSTIAQAQTPPPAPTGATAAWTLKTKGPIRWQQVTPAGALLVSTDAGLAAVDMDRGQIAWVKPELGGLPADGVKMIEGSLLMEAERPGLTLVFDP